MVKVTDPTTLSRARELRRNMTREERRLWYCFLRTHPLHFRRQSPFGRYIVDFYCAAARLAIELDGSQHYEGKGLLYDAIRTERLEEEGVTVLRIPNNVLESHFESVCEYIDTTAKERIAEIEREDSVPESIYL